MLQRALLPKQLLFTLAAAPVHAPAACTLCLLTRHRPQVRRVTHTNTGRLGGPLNGGTTPQCD
eukprot:5615245-Prymnesium_polylepis.1